MIEENDKQEELNDIEDEQNEMFEHYRFVTDPGQKQIRIDKFLVNRLEKCFS